VRGKHQRARHNRHAKALAAQLDQLRAEIEAEARRAAVAAGRADMTRVARQKLAREQAATDSRLQTQENTAARLVSNAKPARAAIAAAQREIDAIGRELTRFSHATIRRMAQAGDKVRITDIHRSADHHYLHTWYQKRTGARLDNDRAVHLEGWIPQATPADREALAPFATSTVLEPSPQACWAWAIPPWLALPGDVSDAPALRRMFGATGSGAPRMPTRPFPGPHLRPDAVITSPWRHTPAIGQPADAVDLAYWYTRSAWIQQWHADQTPVPFWLPAEHAVAYPQNRPLPADTDLRLPYPLIFATFSAPWRIEPRDEELPPALATAQLLILHARGRAVTFSPATLAVHLARLQSLGLTERSQLPTALEALDYFGGEVEGLLLTADTDGTPGDEFAWCVAIGHPTNLPLGRIIVPASRATCGWRHQVANVTAGIALSCWHETLDVPTARPNRQTVGPIGLDMTVADTAVVRVLDIDATSPSSAGSARPHSRGEPGHVAQPHLRRGHWRRQRVGPRREQQQWTWVRPTTVNGNPSLVNQVYYLRRGSG
jgi:hypothetical protein